MVYTMVWYVDGGCRNNGYSNAIGAAAAVDVLRSGWQTTWTMQLPRGSHEVTPTSPRAELHAIKLALENALDKYDTLSNFPSIDLTIHSDSKYAVGCMTTGIHKWSRNGWINSARKPVANQDLLIEMVPLHNRVMELGTLTYKWVPREQNREADAACSKVLDDQEAEAHQDESDSDDSWWS